MEDIVSQLPQTNGAAPPYPLSSEDDPREAEIKRRLAAEKARLEKQYGLTTQAPTHFHRPVERPFTAEERDRVTLLFGGLTNKHDTLMKAVFQGSGYRCANIPTPNVGGFQLGKEFGNNGQCNPTYFTVGNLIQYLQGLESKGLTRSEIIDHYVFFTAGSCGPCRFGMYESEYRLALENAGFGGFRVLLFQQDEGIKAASGEAGLKFTVDFGMGMLNALNLGDILNDINYQIRPYEVNPGESNRVFGEVMDELCRTLREREPFEILKMTPPWLSHKLANNKVLKDIFNTLGKVHEHLYGKAYREALRECWERINGIEVDRTLVKPIVKITGEFWAQTTEGDGNFHMFAFLEKEGAQVIFEPIATWVMYLLNQAKTISLDRKGLDVKDFRPSWWEFKKRLANELNFRKKWLFLSIGEKIYGRQFERVHAALGELGHPLVPQEELARVAHPFYHQSLRGGEGYLEVAKNIYYTENHLCHMVLSLKPFGCMPSSQSDGVQSAVANHFKEMIYLPIETSGEGEINAHSRVQMALGEAKAKAKIEFQETLESTGKSLEQIKDYVSDHPELSQPFYPIPHRHGVAGLAANFVLHVSELMDRGFGVAKFFVS